MKPIKIRIYFGVFFVTKCNTTVYDWKGFRIKTLKASVTDSPFPNIGLI